MCDNKHACGCDARYRVVCCLYLEEWRTLSPFSCVDCARSGHFVPIPSESASSSPNSGEHDRSPSSYTQCTNLAHKLLRLLVGFLYFIVVEPCRRPLGRVRGGTNTNGTALFVGCVYNSQIRECIPLDERH